MKNPNLCIRAKNSNLLNSIPCGLCISCSLCIYSPSSIHTRTFSVSSSGVFSGSYNTVIGTECVELNNFFEDIKNTKDCLITLDDLGLSGECVPPYSLNVNKKGYRDLLNYFTQIRDEEIKKHLDFFNSHPSDKFSHENDFPKYFVVFYKNLPPRTYKLGVKLDASSGNYYLNLRDYEVLCKESNNNRGYTIKIDRSNLWCTLEYPMSDLKSYYEKVLNPSNMSTPSEDLAIYERTLKDSVDISVMALDVKYLQADTSDFTHNHVYVNVIIPGKSIEWTDIILRD